jgi:hypothetical protein
LFREWRLARAGTSLLRLFNIVANFDRSLSFTRQIVAQLDLPNGKPQSIFFERHGVLPETAAEIIPIEPESG